MTEIYDYQLKFANDAIKVFKSEPDRQYWTKDNMIAYKHPSGTVITIGEMTNPVTFELKKEK